MQVKKEFHIGIFDLSQTPIFPVDWISRIKVVCDENAIFSKRDGHWSDSENFNYPKLHSEVQIVTGITVFEKLRWLYDTYANSLLKLAEIATGYKLVIAKDLRSSVNINRIKGVGSNYEWHTDSNHATGILYVTDQTAEDGGCVAFQLPDGQKHIYPKVGKFLAFDAREIPHAVLPLKTESDRISIPMNYYIKDTPQTRPVGLDAYLYSDK
jgi:hypothetical protein